MVWGRSRNCKSQVFQLPHFSTPWKLQIQMFTDKPNKSWIGGLGGGGKGKGKAPWAQKRKRKARRAKKGKGKRADSIF